MDRKFLTLTAALLVAACGKAENGQVTQRQQIGQQWKYEKEKGADGRAIPLAYIGSANSVRTMTAPFTCDLSDCAVEASVDGGAPTSWKGRMTDAKDGISIPPPQRAFEAFEKAKTLTVTLDLGRQGKHSFNFNTAGFDWR